MSRDKHASQRLTIGGLLVTLGIVFGDIGTSPLYVFKAIVGFHPISEELVIGGLSCIIWTLTLQTTIKYIVLTLQADNKGEGGIFSLYALVRSRSGWLFFPGIIGGSALLADGIITPPISVSSAIEGLRILNPHIPTVEIVIVILILLFSVQHFGTKVVGRSFGPIMFLWFLMLALGGASQALEFPSVFKALNPRYAYHLLTAYPEGFWLLGAVFLCTTGAEAMYADLGHCGKQNIRVSWIFVKIALILNYSGQAAWLLLHEGQFLDGRNPFYEMLPRWFLVPGICIATAATVIASQALISGSFTLVTEAMRLYCLPKAKIVYPTELKGQIYVPSTNSLLLLGCIGVVLFFQESSNMEAAYGLAITLTELMTTVLMANFLIMRGVRKPIAIAFLLVYWTIEGSFLFANLSKFAHGGWVTLLVGLTLFIIMYVWNRASLLKRRYTEYSEFANHLPILRELAHDESVPKYATHLVYMTGATWATHIEKKIIYSIFQKQPKRADVYWFLHVDVVDEPYTMDYKVNVLIPDVAFRIDFRLGFRVEPRINLLFRHVIEELSKNGEVDIVSRYDSLRREEIPGDFRFIVLEKSLSYENALPPAERLIMNGYFALKYFSLSEEASFGLDTSSVTTETVPLIIAPMRRFELHRVY